MEALFAATMARPTRSRRREHANGKTYNNRYHFLFTIRDGKIVAVKEYMDTQHLKDLISR